MESVPEICGGKIYMEQVKIQSLLKQTKEMYQRLLIGYRQSPGIWAIDFESKIRCDFWEWQN